VFEPGADPGVLRRGPAVRLGLVEPETASHLEGALRGRRTCDSMGRQHERHAHDDAPPNPHDQCAEYSACHNGRMAAPLVSNVSDTARWVATYRAQETARPDALFKDPFAERLAGERGRAIAAV